MPLSADPSRTYEVSLKIDADKPMESRPSFVCRFPTCREMIAYCAARQAAFDEKDDVNANNLLNAAIASRVVSHRGFTKESLVDVLDDVLTASEKWEVAYTIQTQASVTENNLKNSVAPHSSSGASSARAVEADA